MTSALLVRRRQGAVTLCQSDGLVKVYPKICSGISTWMDISTASYVLKPSSTSRKNSSAITVADKEGIIETPLCNGLVACAAVPSRA